MEQNFYRRLRRGHMHTFPLIFGRRRHEFTGRTENLPHSLLYLSIILLLHSLCFAAASLQLLQNCITAKLWAKGNTCISHKHSSPQLLLSQRSVHTIHQRNWSISLQATYLNELLLFPLIITVNQKYLPRWRHLRPS